MPLCFSRRRWLHVGSLSFQPSETMKVALVLALARYCHGLSPAQMSNPLRLAVPIALIAAPMALILKQPDLGTALMIFLHAAVNMVTGSLPVVGIPLPFISYGGTSLIMHMISLGLSMSAWVHRGERL